VRPRHERQDQPVRLREGKGTLGCRVRRALVAERTVGQRGQQLGFNEGDVPDDRCRAVQNTGQRAQGRGRFAFRQADHRVGITHFA
jgi:hypothetical protein